MFGTPRLVRERTALAERLATPARRCSSRKRRGPCSATRTAGAVPSWSPGTGRPSTTASTSRTRTSLTSTTWSPWSRHGGQEHTPGTPGGEPGSRTTSTSPTTSSLSPPREPVEECQPPERVAATDAGPVVPVRHNVGPGQDHMGAHLNQERDALGQMLVYCSLRPRLQFYRQPVQVHAQQEPAYPTCWSRGWAPFRFHRGRRQHVAATLDPRLDSWCSATRRPAPRPAARLTAGGSRRSAVITCPEGRCRARVRVLGPAIADQDVEVAR